MTSDISGGWLVKKGVNDRSTLLLSRLFILIIGSLSLGIALYMQGIIKSLLLGYTVFTAGLVIPTLLALFTDRFPVRTEWAMSAMILGGGTALWGKLSHFSLAGFMGMGLCAIMMIIGIARSKIMKKVSQVTSSVEEGIPASSQPLSR
jgi:Na+/proline symporter